MNIVLELGKVLTGLIFGKINFRIASKCYKSSEQGMLYNELAYRNILRLFFVRVSKCLEIQIL